MLLIQNRFYKKEMTMSATNENQSNDDVFFGMIGVGGVLITAGNISLAFLGSGKSEALCTEQISAMQPKLPVKLEDVKTCVEQSVTMNTWERAVNGHAYADDFALLGLGGMAIISLAASANYFFKRNKPSTTPAPVNNPAAAPAAI